MVVFGNRTNREGKVNDVEVNSYGFIAGDVEPEFRKDENNAARVPGASDLPPTVPLLRSRLRLVVSVSVRA